MVNISRILKFLTRHGYDEFGWNDHFLKCTLAFARLPLKINVAKI